MTAVKRMLQYLDKKGISKYKFYKDTGLSNGFLDKGNNIGSDKCEKIGYVYTDLNMDWVVTGRGDMIKTQESVKESNFIASEPDDTYRDGNKSEVYYEQTIKALNKTITAQEKTIKLLEDALKAERAVKSNIPETPAPPAARVIP